MSIEEAWEKRGLAIASLVNQAGQGAVSLDAAFAILDEADRSLALVVLDEACQLSVVQCKQYVKSSNVHAHHQELRVQLEQLGTALPSVGQ